MSETSNPFDLHVDRWRQYSQSPKGRLRLEITWHNLEQHLGALGGSPRVLDAGCGFGEMAAPLLGRAEKLVLFDFSKNMLEEAGKRLAAQYPAAGGKRVELVRGRVEDLDSRLPPGFFDLILCHSVLEFVEEPSATLAGVARRLAPGGLLSLVAANRFNEPLKAALARSDLRKARLAIHQTEFPAELFGSEPKRAFSLDELERMAGGLELEILGRYGIRIFADFLPEALMREAANYRPLLELEKEAARQDAYLRIARYFHLICRKKED